MTERVGAQVKVFEETHKLFTERYESFIKP